MSVNPQTIRAERHAEIGTIIQRDATLLIDRWAKRVVEEQPTARRVHHHVLLNHLPSFLQEVGTTLADSENPESQPHRRPAVEHGKQRLEVGWSLGEVIRDYQVLRLVVLDHLDTALDRPLRLREVQAVGLALDEAIEASVERYVGSRDEQIQQIQQSLHEADQRKNEFLATLAHELRNPLAPLRNSLEVIRVAGNSPALLQQVRELMDRQVHQLTRLVEDLLDVSSIAQGKLVLRRERCDLRTVLDQAVQMNVPLRESRRHRLDLFLASEPLWVKGDQTRLVQIAINLLNNAAKYTPSGGQITLTAARDGYEAVLRVKDNGIGIPLEKQARIFDLFTQIDLGPERSLGGLGIGLTLVRRLVELHGGTIAVCSAGIGQGSEFVVRLPLVEEPPQAAPAAKEHETTPGRHILIVEDNQDSRESLALLLQMVGHQVVVAEDGPKGVAGAQANRPEIALIDIGLPGLDGYQVARQLRTLLGDGVLLVALTGYSQPEDRQRAIEAGFNAHLTKPVEFVALQALLAGHHSPVP